MTKLSDKIEALKLEYPTLTKGVNNEVFELTAEEYEATINRWAEYHLTQLEEIAAENQKAAAKAALLAQLGITEEQAKLLLN